MNRFSMQDRSNRIAFIVGAIAGIFAIKTQPDGNLLVTTVCALIAGACSLIAWVVLRR